MQQFRIKKTKSKTFVPPSVLKKRAEGRKGSAGYQRAKKFRSSEAWRNCRAVYISRFPVCQFCDQVPAMEVHHILPVTVSYDLRLCADNLLSTCCRCHELIHARMVRPDCAETVKAEIARIKNDVRK